VKLATEERQLQDYLEHERKEIFTDGKTIKDSNPEAHPYSGMYFMIKLIFFLSVFWFLVPF